eukprot:scaffold2840_cov379-Prasinococcus_capsulatus_cf.AAC.8
MNVPLSLGALTSGSLPATERAAARSGPRARSEVHLPRGCGTDVRAHERGVNVAGPACTCKSQLRRRQARSTTSLTPPSCRSRARALGDQQPPPPPPPPPWARGGACDRSSNGGRRRQAGDLQRDGR